MLPSIQDLFSETSDADYYDAYAIGQADYSLNSWPSILRFLNNIGLYTRSMMTLVLVLISSIIIPYLISNLAVIIKYSSKLHVYIFCFLSINIYPTLFSCSLVLLFFGCIQRSVYAGNFPTWGASV